MTETPRARVESFNLDHRAVVAPYVRLADRKELKSGGVVSKFDVRFTQPNVAHLDGEAVHSVEHMFAEFSRAHSDRIIDFSPMGCLTGFYLALDGDFELAEVEALIERTLRDVLEASEVPAANEVQCGWAAHHSLEKAKDAVRPFLAARAEWSTVMA